MRGKWDPLPRQKDALRSRRRQMDQQTLDNFVILPVVVNYAPHRAQQVDGFIM